MIVVRIIIGVIAAVGFGFILADAFRIPTLKASKAASNMGKKGSKKTSTLEIYLGDLADKIAGKLKLNEFKRANLEIDLRTAGMHITPEQYTAEAIVKALLFAIPAIPVFFFSKIIGLLLLGIAVFLYFSESKAVSRKIGAKRKKIENELPGFVGHIKETLTHSRDLIYVLDSYLRVSGPELKEELLITLADMRSTGNNAEALSALDNRIGSPWLSEVVAGLKLVENSADTSTYWMSLGMKFREFRKDNLKAQAAAMPRKVKKLSLALMLCFLLVYVAVIGQVLLNSFSTMF